MIIIMKSVDECVVLVFVDIQVAHAENGWRETAAIVLERLWKSYGIIHAMLMAPCSQTGENVKFLLLFNL